MPEKVLIVDFGSQYTQLISRRIREAQVFSEIVPPLERVNLEGVLALVLSGGPMSVLDEASPRLSSWVLEADLPVLGICYGHQLLAKSLGGKVRRAKRREYGLAIFKRKRDHPVFEGLPEKFKVWMSHGDEVEAIPPDFVSLGSTEGAKIAAMAHRERPIVSLQFHPEVKHTEKGEEILKNFLFRVASLEPTWRLKDFIEEKIEEIRETTRGEGVALALSGGVDSMVLAHLLLKAVGGRLLPIFVDTGLLKSGERERVKKIAGNLPNLRMIDAKDRFFEVLKGVTDPEEKRMRIGKLFADIFLEEVEKSPFPVGFLAQGTLYPDVIESGRGIGPASKIKSHHNVGGLPQDLPLKLIEPFKLLFKDEVRKVGRILGLPEEVITRHPFPGPGFAVRIIGEVTEERVEILRRADKIIEEEIRRAGLYEEIWQVFPVLMPLKTVGVMGDMRTYQWVIAIRAVTSLDGMTADWVKFPHDLLDRIARRIVGEVRGVNRVVYDITSKPPSTIEWE